MKNRIWLICLSKGRRISLHHILPSPPDLRRDSHTGMGAPIVGCADPQVDHECGSIFPPPVEAGNLSGRRAPRVLIHVPNPRFWPLTSHRAAQSPPTICLVAGVADDPNSANLPLARTQTVITESRRTGPELPFRRQRVPRRFVTFCFVSFHLASYRPQDLRSSSHLPLYIIRSRGYRIWRNP